MNRLLNKVILITESNSSIGKKTARLAAKEGAIIVCTGNNLKKIHPIVSEIQENGGYAAALHHEITSLKSWQTVVTQTVEKFGKIDILVNNAGISAPKIILDLSADDCKKVQTVDINSIIYGLKETIPNMIKNKSGAIINVSSIEGLVGLDNDHPCQAAKDVIHSLSLEAAYEYAEQNIRVNSICPGTIETPLIEVTFPTKDFQFKQSTHFPYLGKAEDIANSIIFLASDEASFVTGAKLVITGDRIPM